MKWDYKERYAQDSDGIHTRIYRPILEVRFIGSKTALPPVDCRVDTGADDVMIPEFNAGFLGVMLDESRRIPIETMGRSGSAVYHTIDLEITDGKSSWRWSARVGFHDGPSTLYALGHNGFLEHFTATFDGKQRHFSLLSNGTFPPPSSPRS